MTFHWPDFPFVRTLKNYSLPSFRDDFRAGVTVALLAVPQCMAYALLAEMNPIYGLYAALVGVIVGGLFASSETIITGPTAKVSLVVGSVLIATPDIDPVTAVVILTILVGLIQILFSFVRAGDLSSFISHSVIQGFIFGGGLVIIGDQLIYLLDAAGDKSPYFLIRIYDAASVLLESGSVPWVRLAIGAVTILLLVMLRQLPDYIPASFLTIVMGGLVSGWFDFAHQGVDLVGSIPTGLPYLTLPVSNPQYWKELLPGAFALAVLGSVQTISISSKISQTTGTDLDENQTVFGQGMTNVATGFLNGFPVSASFTRSFLNAHLGATTRVSSLVCGFFIATVLLVAAPALYYIPIPVLAGVIIVVVMEIFDVSEIRTLLRVTTIDRVAFLVTMISMLALKLDTAIYVGVASTIVIYLRESSKLDLKEYVLSEDGQLRHVSEPKQRVNQQIALIDVNGEVFFGAADRIRTRVRNLVRESEELKVIILRLKNAMNLDSSSARVFRQIAEELRRRDKTLILSGVTPEIREFLLDSGLADDIGRDKILIAQQQLLESTRQAISRSEDYIEEVLEGSVSRAEENPDLAKTLKQLVETDEEPQNPIDSERINPHE